MSKQADTTLIGAFVVGAVALVVAGVLIFSSGRLFSSEEFFVMHFEGSVAGLDVGAPVVFQGVQVGTVEEITLRVNPSDLSLRIPVVARFEPERVQGLNSEISSDAAGFAERLIDKGLRAQLKNQSLVTGKLMVELAFHPETEPRLMGSKRYFEVPTIPSRLQEFDRIATKLMNAIDEMPLREMGERLVSTLEGIDRLANAPEVRGSLKNFNQSMESLQALLKILEARIAGLVTQLQKQVEEVTSGVDLTLRDARAVMAATERLMERFGGTVEGLDETLGVSREMLEQGRLTMKSLDELVKPGSSLRYELTVTLQGLSRAAGAVRNLADYLERHPEALLQGKQGPGGE